MADSQVGPDGYQRLPVDAYVGLTMVEADELAAQEGRYVVDMTNVEAWELNFPPDRVRVVLGDSGRVERATGG